MTDDPIEKVCETWIKQWVVPSRDTPFNTTKSLTALVREQVEKALDNVDAEAGALVETIPTVRALKARVAQLEAKVKELADANGFDALRAEKLKAALDDAETELRFVEETQAAILKTRIALLEAALEKSREFSRTVSSMLGRFPQSVQLQWKEFAEALAKVDS